MRGFWKRWRAQREVGRPIPGYYRWYMNSRERMMWICLGWRVTYWVCPLCGVRRPEDAPTITASDGWRVPKVHLCPEVE